MLVLLRLLPRGAHVEQVDEEVVGELAGAVGEHAVRRIAVIGAEHAQPADQHRHLRRRQRQQLGAVDQELFGRHRVLGVDVVAEAIGLRLERFEGFRVGHFVRRIRAAGRDRHVDARSGVLRGLFDRSGAAKHDEIGQRDLLAAGLGVVERLADILQDAEHLFELGRLVDLPVLLRRKADACAIGAATLVRAAERRCRRPCGIDELAHGQAGRQHLGLQFRDVGAVDERVVDRRHRILPDQVFGRHLGAEIADLGAHVAMSQLEPGAGKGVGESVRVLVEMARDLLVGRVEPERQVGRQHVGRAALAGLLRVLDGVDGLRVLRLPLVGAGRALGQLPLVFEQVAEEAHAPLGRRRGPDDLEARGELVRALAGLVAAGPAEALFGDIGAFGLSADQVGATDAVRLAEGVSAGDQRDSLLVVHRHAREGLADVLGGGDRVGRAVRAFGIDVDEAHLDRGERIGQSAALAVALVAQPFLLGAPEDILLWLVDVLAAAAEAEGLEAHGFERDIARQDHQVGPGEAVAVFLLHRPEQAARLVEVGVVRPAVERGEALRAGGRAAAAVAGAIGAGAVPGHADHERAVIAPVRGPPVLAVSQHLGDVSLDLVQVELLELFGVVERPFHGIPGRRVLVKDAEIELVRPPVPVASTSETRVHDGAFARFLNLGVHSGLLSAF